MLYLLSYSCAYTFLPYRNICYRLTVDFGIITLYSTQCNVCEKERENTICQRNLFIFIETVTVYNGPRLLGHTKVKYMK